MTVPINEVLVGDALQRLKELPDECVHCCVTSPPYWGLRDYGVEEQVGLEASPEEYVARLVSVFREIRRVLRPDGTLWLNMGDCYATGAGRGVHTKEHAGKQAGRIEAMGPMTQPNRMPIAGLKPKDLVGMPWRIAFALQADGWYLRSDIIWSKPNPMPESVTDRPTKSHEYLFLFAKGQSSLRTIEFLDLKPETIHFNRDLGSEGSYAWPTDLCVCLATAVFNSSQEQQDFCLPPFYAKEWKKTPNGGDSELVSNLPADHLLAAYAARFLDGEASTKEFLCELNRSRVDLTDTKHLLIRRRLSERSHPPCIFVDGNGTIAVHDAGQIRKIDLLHGNIVVTVPTTCKYYYDQEAIAEPLSQASLARLAQPTFDRQKGGPKDFSNGVNPNREAMPSRGTRNRRSVWEIPTHPFPDAHFAVYPEELIEPCILAGTPPDGIVLDPFFGSGTTGLVALKAGRKFIGIELNPEYAKMAEARVWQEKNQARLV